MSLDAPVYWLAAFMLLELPGGDVRLCDGGVLKYDGAEYGARHAVWGGLAEVPPAETMVGDLAPGGTIALAPDPDTPISVLQDASLAGCRVRAWLGEVDPDTMEVAEATLLGDWLIDFQRVRTAAGSRIVLFELITRAERLFLANRGNVCSPRFHKSVWPGEKGFDNCTDVEVQVPWGTQAAPSGTAPAPNPGGGGGGGRTWLDALR